MSGIAVDGRVPFRVLRASLVGCTPAAFRLPRRVLPADPSSSEMVFPCRCLATTAGRGARRSARITSRASDQSSSGHAPKRYARRDKVSARLVRSSSNFRYWSAFQVGISSPIMIIDCHGHYTTAPKELQAYRDSQIAALKDPAQVPSKGTLN